YYFFGALLLFPYLLSLLRLVSRDRIKQLFLRWNFKGMSKIEMQRAGINFYLKMQRKCYPKALDWIQAQHELGTELVLVSASCKEWLAPFAQAFQAEILCTTLEYDSQEVCTGNWSGKNVRGREKVEIVRRNFDLQQYNEIVAFGNEQADLHLGEIANSVYLNYFRA
ncbi:MAG: hypothetical protein A3D92_11335, partial [Bacteroidetes bacterium RIFCSPHIGHO2_02_FULL_44_7]